MVRGVFLPVVTVLLAAMLQLTAAAHIGVSAASPVRNVSRHHNNTVSEGPTSRCAQLSDALWLDPACQLLGRTLSQDGPSDEACNSECYNKFMASIKQLKDLNCTGRVEVDTIGFQSYCDRPSPSPSPSEIIAEPPSTSNIPTPDIPSDPSGVPSPTSEPPVMEPSPLIILPSESPFPIVPVVVIRPSSCRHLNNCSHHGLCHKGECSCEKAYGRKDCSEYTLDKCPDMCYGRGRCVVDELSNTYSCQCDPGFSGANCSEWSGCDAFDFCSGHGQCSSEDSCACTPPFAGPSCHEPRHECPYLCSARGTCNQTLMECSCNDGFVGEACNQLSSTFHCSSNCNGKGMCNPNGLCTCMDNTAGFDCTRAVVTCDLPCHHGVCGDNECKCLGPFAGPRCNTYISKLDRECSELDLCSGRGICIRTEIAGEFVAVCDCFNGFKGLTCSEVDDVVECPRRCSGHGRCVLSATSHCLCDEAYGGSDCASPRCPVNLGNLCSGHGICEGGFCNCDEGWTHGILHACEASLCPNACSGNGKCLSSGCQCAPGFSGSDCVTPINAPLISDQPSTVIFPEPSPRPEVQMTFQGQSDSSLSGVVFASGSSGTTITDTSGVSATSGAISAEGCPSDCNGHGNCIDNVCVCIDQYSGYDCVIAPSEKYTAGIILD